MDPFMLPHSSSPCPHELWFMFDLDGELAMGGMETSAATEIRHGEAMTGSL